MVREDRDRDRGKDESSPNPGGEGPEDVRAKVDALKHQLRYQTTADIERLQESLDEMRGEQRKFSDFASRQDTEIKLIRQVLQGIEKKFEQDARYGERLALVERAVEPLPHRVEVLESKAAAAGGGLSVAKVVVAAAITIIVSLSGAALTSRLVHAPAPALTHVAPHPVQHPVPHPAVPQPQPYSPATNVTR